MGIEGKFTRFDERRATRVADDMLGRVLQAHTEKRAVLVMEQNRVIFGEIIPVSVQTKALTVVARNVPVEIKRSFPVPVAKTATITIQALFTAALLVRLLRTRRRGREEDVLTFIARTLIARSPVGPSGRYRDSHVLLADGKVVATAAQVAAGADVPPAKVYAFTSNAPFSRKIEIGKTKSGRDFVISVPNRMHQRTAGDAKAKYPTFKIYFSFESQDVGELGDWSRSASAQRLARRVRRGSTARHQAWLSRQPTITIEMP